MTSPEARAAEVIDYVGDEPSNVVAAALSKEGLLAPEPQIIRTREELVALDPDTLVLDAAGYTVRYGSQVTGWDLPLAIIRDGAEVRAARQALKEVADAVD